MPVANSTLIDILKWLRAITPSAHLSSDSRRIAAGDIFIAYPGDTADGRTYIAHALARGAQAVVYEAADFAWDAEWTVPQLAVSGLKDMAGEIASAYYGEPDRGMFTVAVTGTNGKTSCTQWLGSVLSRLGDSTGVIGTLGIGVFRRGGHNAFITTGYTTPDAVLLQREIASLRDADVKALAIEASSIGLDQKRLNGMHVDVAVFTNLTRDHLDFHGDMAAYEAAKTLLFNWSGLRHAVINLDDPMGLRLVSHLQSHQPQVAITGYTLEGRSCQGTTILGADIRTSHAGTTFHINTLVGAMQVKTHLVGQFNVSNVLAIIGVLLTRGIALRTAIDAVELLIAVPGRMQQLGGEEGPLVVIDYAHTPDALEKTLAALRKVAQQRHGQLWCVFGCGGDRDPGKRPQMGAMAEAADHVIVTSDNPRGEEPAAIIAQVVAGMTRAPTDHMMVEDRAAAILWAIKHAGKHDVILLAGKGHETYQEIKGRKLPFLDEDHAALALAARATMRGGANESIVG